MTQYNILSVKLANSQFNKSKSGMKNGTEVILKLSFKVAGVHSYQVLINWKMYHVIIFQINCY